MARYTVKQGKRRELKARPLDKSTWLDFARLVERHNGVWGGCWCLSFHLDRGEHIGSSSSRPDRKKKLVLEDRSHASLVYDGKEAVGWCQFGPTAELPGIKNRKNYEAGQSFRPDWRITCFFVDKKRRGEGIASMALRGALRDIARKGGGTVEAYPEVVKGRSVPGSFLCNGTISMFEREGFERTRQIGMHMWVMTKTVRKSRDSNTAK